jgi:hypothetical protein
VAAIAPAATTPATPTPAVTADSRFMPRRLSADGGSGRSPGLLGIGRSFPCWVGRRGATPVAAGRLVRYQRRCVSECRGTYGVVLNYF